MFQKTKYYKNIDECPILVYDKVNETQDLFFLAYKGKPKLKDALKHWEYIENQVFWEFGLSPEYMQILRLKQDYARYLHQYHIKGDLSSKPMAEYTFRTIQKQAEKIPIKENIGKVCAKLSKSYGYQIDPSKVSVRMFFSMINE